MNSYQQLGNDILDVGRKENASRQVAMSQDGSIVAVGFSRQDSDRYLNAGKICVFRYDDTTSSWIQIGQDLQGADNQSEFGFDLELSGDGKRLVTQQSLPDDTDIRTEAIVYEYNDVTDTWEQLGQSLIFPVEVFGSQPNVSISADGNVITFTVFLDPSYVVAYKLNGNQWIQYGNTINFGNNMTYRHKLSEDGTVLIVSGFEPVLSSTEPAARVFRYDTGTWVQVGDDLPVRLGSFSMGYLPVAIKLDGTRVAVSDPFYFDPNTFQQANYVRVFDLVNGMWMQKGTDLTDGVRIGRSIDLSDDRIFIGDSQRPGRALVYEFDDDANDWEPVGQPVEGILPFTSFGWHIQSSRDGTRFISSAIEFPNYAIAYELNSSNQWEQLGEVFESDPGGDQSGLVTDISRDGLTVAVSAPNARTEFDDFATGGTVKVYTYDSISDQWNQLGDSFIPDQPNFFFGDRLSLSGLGRRIAIISPLSIYDWNGTTWVQIPNPSFSPLTSTIVQIALSDDGNTLAVLSRDEDADFGTNPPTITTSLYLSAYTYNGSTWDQIGTDTLIKSDTEFFNVPSLRLSHDGQTALFSIATFPGNDVIMGDVRAYRFINGDWEQIGSVLTGTENNDLFGQAIAISGDGNLIAVGSPRKDNNDKTNGGAVSSYIFNGSDWQQLGDTITGSTIEQRLGSAVDLDREGRVLTIGEPSPNGKGRVSFYELLNNKWEFLTTIPGTQEFSQHGLSLALAADERIIVIGAPLFDDQNSNTGIARVFQFDSIVSKNLRYWSSVLNGLC